MNASDLIRKPAVAGMFYSGQKDNLSREISVFLENSSLINNVNQIYGLMAPHAGYMYSGGVAARAYRQIVGKEFDIIVVISPSHRIYFEEVSIFNGKAYSTPLGEIQVDRELAKQITEENSQIIYSDLGHDIDEHALEVQLPFLQIVQDDFKIVPIVMGNQDKGNIEILTNALTKLLKGKNALIIASSDLSHYHSHSKATAMDNVIVDCVANYEEDKLYDKLQEGLCEMCGGGPAITTMKTCRNLGADKSKVLLYRNSGDVTDDRSQVVGYMSAMFYK